MFSKGKAKQLSLSSSDIKHSARTRLAQSPQKLKSWGISKSPDFSTLWQRDVRASNNPPVLLNFNSPPWVAQLTFPIQFLPWKAGKERSHRFNVKIPVWSHPLCLWINTGHLLERCCSTTNSYIGYEILKYFSAQMKKAVQTGNRINIKGQPAIMQCDTKIKNNNTNKKWTWSLFSWSSHYTVFLSFWFVFYFSPQQFSHGTHFTKTLFAHHLFTSVLPSLLYAILIHLF